MGLSQRIHEEGKLALSRGAFDFFKEFSRDEIEEQFTFAARHTELSQYNLRETLISKLVDLEKSRLVRFCIHGRDAFLYSTAALYVWASTKGNRQATFTRMQLDPVLQTHKEIVKGDEQKFNDLIVDDRGNILLTNDDPAPSIAKFRVDIDSLIKDQNLAAFLPTWQHMVVARIMDYPEGREADLLDAIDELQRQVRSLPFKMIVHEMWSGCVADLLL